MIFSSRRLNCRFVHRSTHNERWKRRFCHTLHGIALHFFKIISYILPWNIKFLSRRLHKLDYTVFGQWWCVCPGLWPQECSSPQDESDVGTKSFDGSSYWEESQFFPHLLADNSGQVGSRNWQPDVNNLGTGIRYIQNRGFFPPWFIFSGFQTRGIKDPT